MLKTAVGIIASVAWRFNRLLKPPSYAGYRHYSIISLFSVNKYSNLFVIILVATIMFRCRLSPAGTQGALQTTITTTSSCTSNLLIINIILTLFYFTFGCVSQVLETIQFTNLIVYWLFSRFSYLDWHLHVDWSHFGVKKMEAKIRQKERMPL